MKYSVKVRTNAREQKLQQLDDVHFLAWVHAAPEKGRANEELCRLFAEHFECAPSSVSIVRGAASHKKTIEIC